MTGAPPRTDFSGLSDQVPAPPYTAVAANQEALATPKFQENRGGMRKPYPLPIYVPPPIKQFS